MYLASAGYCVDVVERRPHPGQLEVDKQRTYLIGLGEACSLQHFICARRDAA
jgi:hypothetical protein